MDRLKCPNSRRPYNLQTIITIQKFTNKKQYWRVLKTLVYPTKTVFPHDPDSRLRINDSLLFVKVCFPIANHFFLLIMSWVGRCSYFIICIFLQMNDLNNGNDGINLSCSSNFFEQPTNLWSIKISLGHHISFSFGIVSCLLCSFPPYKPNAIFSQYEKRPPEK